MENQRKVNCPLFRRIFARIFDLVFCFLIILLIALIIVNKKIIEFGINNIFLNREEMIIISVISFFLFFLYFTIFPTLNQGRTMFKYFFKIHCQYEKKKIPYQIFVKELGQTTIPLFVTMFLPISFSSAEFNELFKGEGTFIENWNLTSESLPFRIIYFIPSTLFLLSTIIFFISKENKTLFDYMANIWVFIYVKKEEPKQLKIKSNSSFIRPGEAFINKDKNKFQEDLK